MNTKNHLSKGSATEFLGKSWANPTGLKRQLRDMHTRPKLDKRRIKEDGTSPPKDPPHVCRAISNSLPYLIHDLGIAHKRILCPGVRYRSST